MSGSWKAGGRVQEGVLAGVTNCHSSRRNHRPSPRDLHDPRRRAAPARSRQHGTVRPVVHVFARRGSGLGVGHRSGHRATCAHGRGPASAHSSCARAGHSSAGPICRAMSPASARKHRKQRRAVACGRRSNALQVTASRPRPAAAHLGELDQPDGSASGIGALAGARGGLIEVNGSGLRAGHRHLRRGYACREGGIVSGGARVEGTSGSCGDPRC